MNSITEKHCSIRSFHLNGQTLGFSSIDLKVRAILHESRLLLLRRFVSRMAEASAKQVTGDEPQGTMGRVQTAGAHNFIKRETSGYEAGMNPQLLAMQWEDYCLRRGLFLKLCFVVLF